MCNYKCGFDTSFMTWYRSLGIRIPRELGFGYPSPLGVVRCRVRYVGT